jgi:hypothetical protein
MKPNCHIPQGDYLMSSVYVQELERRGAGVVVRGCGACGLLSAQLHGGCRVRGAAPSSAVDQMDAIRY